MKRYIIFYGGFIHRAGGAFNHAKTINDRLKSYGDSSEIITLDNLPLAIRYIPHILEKSINLLLPPVGFIIKQAVIRFFFKALHGGKGDAHIFEDIYIAHDSDKRAVCLLHAVWTDNIQGKAPNRLAYNYALNIEKRMINRLKMPVITVSESYKQYIEGIHFGGHLEKSLIVLEPGLPMAQITQRLDQIKSFAKRQNSIVYCGSLEPRKNVFFLLDVYMKVLEYDPSFTLTIIGDGVDERSLRQTAESKLLPVRFLGRLSSDEVLSELSRSSHYVHSSTKESFSFSLLEAKLCGLITFAHHELQVPDEFIDYKMTGFYVEEWARSITHSTEPRTRVDFRKYSSERHTKGLIDYLEKSIQPNRYAEK
jgi:glycosyltransferase involved in cell wall biosynthesis